MKKIYTFNIPTETEIEEPQITKDESGNEIKALVKVKKTTNRTFFIARPSRSISDDADIFRAAEESELIRRGVITSTLLSKRLLNDGGVLSEEQKKNLEKLEKDFIEKQKEYTELSLIEETKRTEEQKNRIEVLLTDLTGIMSDIQRFNDSTSSLYNRTAEALARNKTILWLTLFLSYEEKDGKEIPVFPGKSFEEKIKVYDVIEESEDAYQYDLIQKFMLLIGSWYMGKTNTKEEFDLLLAMAENRGLLNI